jgi:hypothetical protein
MTTRARERLAGHSFRIQCLAAESKASRKEPARLFRAENRIPNQFTVLRDPQNLIRRELIPAMRARHLGNKPQLPRDLFRGRVVNCRARRRRRGCWCRALRAIVISLRVPKTLLMRNICPAFGTKLLMDSRLCYRHSPTLSPCTNYALASEHPLARPDMAKQLHETSPDRGYANQTNTENQRNFICSQINDKSYACGSD